MEREVGCEHQDVQRCNYLVQLKWKTDNHPLIAAAENQ